MPTKVFVAAAAIAFLPGGSGTPFPPPSIEDAVTTASANIASNISARSHLGFDTYAYPGDEEMRAWRDADKPYEWIGYYLTAPCHRDDSFMGKRKTLRSMGWGMAVIYVGQQTWGRVPGQKIVVTRYVTKRVRQVRTRNGRRVVRYVKKRVPVRVKVRPRAVRGASCSTQFVTSARGTADANDAIAKTAAEGFPAGTVIFLDIERMNAVPRAMRDYYRAWTARVLADGRFQPAYYAHKNNAGTIYRDVKRTFTAAGITSDPQFWIASGRGFTEDKHPTEVGHSFATIWQGVLDIVETHNGVKLPIDINVARVPSPSEHYAAAK